MVTQVKKYVPVSAGKSWKSAEHGARSYELEFRWKLEICKLQILSSLDLTILILYVVDLYVFTFFYFLNW